jgi:ribonuclease Y
MLPPSSPTPAAIAVSTWALLPVLVLVLVVVAVFVTGMVLVRQRPHPPEPASAPEPDPARLQALEDRERRLAEQEQRVAEHEGRVAEQEQRVTEHERRVAEQEQRVADHEQRVAVAEQRLDEQAGEVRERADAVARAEQERREALERVAGLSSAQARAEVVAGIEQEARRQGVLNAHAIERAAEADAEHRARGVLATVIQRLASEQTSESVVSLVPLPGEDMKGRIIGREGRNIRSFEQVTGVNLVIDDTPGAVLLSCFDPTRREIARVTLVELITDGRIHPTRIEEVYARSVVEVERLCVRAGQQAALEVGITDLHPQLVVTLGRLQYRSSYGQNVLRHLVESGHAAGLLADEIGVHRASVVRGAFLHDIGKALTHEVEGSHARVGAELARSHGEHEDVVHAIEAHHNEVEPRTVEAVLTQAADAISGGRPGARRESLDVYVDRLQRLEEIAMARPGVDKVFAMQAGRDVRVMVAPDLVDDLEAQALARDIARQYEKELSYPGQIKVTVVRESRATETAR